MMQGTPAPLTGTLAALAAGVFTIQLVDPESQTTITAEAPSLDNALGFVRDCCGCEAMLPSRWKERDRRWVMKLFDWDECWGPESPPALARIIAPPGFVPPPLPAGSMV